MRVRYSAGQDYDFDEMSTYWEDFSTTNRQNPAWRLSTELACNGPSTWNFVVPNAFLPNRSAVESSQPSAAPFVGDASSRLRIPGRRRSGSSSMIPTTSWPTPPAAASSPRRGRSSLLVPVHVVQIENRADFPLIS
ncbi:hypothetical protein [Arthrobacter sp. ok909]|uniref:hypothetical protein n=1 Tax=Arthrobacter sp. ok909 TaxID=1761746 RepID=UPI001113E218|nr:hypothetical protein [Arthrobacter sp. ok909]